MGTALLSALGHRGPENKNFSPGPVGSWQGGDEGPHEAGGAGKPLSYCLSFPYSFGDVYVHVVILTLSVPFPHRSPNTRVSCNIIIFYTFFLC